MPISSDYLAVPSEHIIGVITDLRDEVTEYGPKIVMEVMPLGEENPRFKRYNQDTARSRKSDWQKMLKKFRILDVDTSDANNIIGLIVNFEMVDHTFEDRDTGEERSYDTWKPVKVYENEAAALVDLAAIVESQPESAAPVSSIPAGVLGNAKLVWAAMDGQEDAFRAISWPEGTDVDELVKAVS
jgi:hypothetical protein